MILPKARLQLSLPNWQSAEPDFTADPFGLRSHFDGSEERSKGFKLTNVPRYTLLKADIII